MPQTAGIELGDRVRGIRSLRTGVVVDIRRGNLGYTYDVEWDDGSTPGRLTPTWLVKLESGEKDPQMEYISMGGL